MAAKKKMRKQKTGAAPKKKSEKTNKPVRKEKKI